MKYKYIYFCVLYPLIVAKSMAQNSDTEYFYSVQYKSIGTIKVDIDDNQYCCIEKEEGRLSQDASDSTGRIEVEKNIILSSDTDSLDQIQAHVINVQDKIRKVKVLELYKGEGKPLSYFNLICMMEELGISNQLYVLAQACLETGWFKSRVCKDYHNLFGLYNSKEGDYYRFTKWEDSVVAYKKFIQYKYKGGNYLQFLQNIHYAEDSLYLKKVGDVMNRLENM